VNTRNLTFIDFYKSDLRNAWIYDAAPHLDVYVRHAKRMVDGKLVEMFDIASIEVVDGHRGQGIFTSFLNAAEELILPDKIIFIENVLDPRFQEFFRKQGYIDWGPRQLDCFIKRKRT
jgi:GNAT superfamily N-acetyltransferase